MRLSVFDDDPAIRALCARARVWLDGEEVTHKCQAADDDAGYVLLLVRDRDNHIVRNEAGAPERVERYGRVSIILGVV